MHSRIYLHVYICIYLGKLAIVVSDDSLAFGVNMPFRTCVFAGEMNGELTPLMAQQVMD